MVLHLVASQLNDIALHAERTYPEECCGLLIGTFDRDRSAIWVAEVWAVENAWDDQAEAAMRELYQQGKAHPQNLTKFERYWIDPKTMLEAQRYGRDRQLDIIGIYHSHPDHPALPSECDRLLAWAQYAYIIVSVQQGVVQDFRCWRLDTEHQFQPEEIMIVPK
ncbi:MAG: M67 family metallopeptidase [Elainellaceae cyanobacterium]